MRHLVVLALCGAVLGQPRHLGADCQGVVFGATQAIPLTGNFVGLETADLDGDGDLDLAVANMGGDVKVLLGTGTGTFGAPQSYQARLSAGFPHDVVAADVTGDGKLDLAVALLDTNAISILAGNGDGSFVQPPQVFQAAQGYPAFSPAALTTIQWTEDSIPDLVVSNSGTDTNSFAIVAGGSFISIAVYGLGGTNRWSLAASDFNADGADDIAVVNYGSNNFSILFGGMSPAAGGTYAVGMAPREVAAADFDNDGIVDLAVTNSGSGSVSALRGMGDGTFAPATHYPTGTNTHSVAVGDFDGDRKIDLAVTNQDANNVSILLGNGDGTFVNAGTYPAQSPRNIVVGDFNADGKLDLAAATDASVSVILNTCLIKGDWNGNGAVEVGDAFHGINALFASGPPTASAGNINGDTAFNAGDVLYLLLYLFANGPEPV